MLMVRGIKGGEPDRLLGFSNVYGYGGLPSANSLTYYGILELILGYFARNLMFWYCRKANRTRRFSSFDPCLSTYRTCSRACAKSPNAFSAASFSFVGLPFTILRTVPVIFLAFDSFFDWRTAGFFVALDAPFANPFFVFAMPAIIAA